MITEAISKIIDRVVDRHPRPFKAALIKKDPSMFVQELGNWDKQSWENFDSQGEVKGFEDLVTLFTVGKFNRSIVRLDLDEAALLFKTVRSLGRSRGVEIGRGWGGSTMLLVVAAGEGGKVISVELSPSHDEDLLRVLTKAGLQDRIRMMVGDSRTADIGEKEIDWVFIDGGHDHEVARGDHNRWGQMVRPGGYIIHHDATITRPGATGCEQLLKLRDKILDVQKDALEKWSEAGSLIVFKRTSAAWVSV